MGLAAIDLLRMLLDPSKDGVKIKPRVCARGFRVFRINKLKFVGRPASIRLDRVIGPAGRWV